MKKLITFCLAAICGCSLIAAQGADVNDLVKSAKLIPIVEYSPEDFEMQVKDAFHFEAWKPCFFIKKEAKGYETYWYNDYSRKGEFKLSPINENLPLSARQREVMQSADSVFIFNPYPTYPYEFIPQNVSYIGYRVNGLTRYVTADSVFDSLAGLVSHNFGSTGNFIATYLNKVKEAFSNTDCGLYDLRSDNELLAVLRDSYEFNAVSGQPDSEIIRLYIGMIKSRFNLTQDQEAKLESLCRALIKTDGQNTADFLKGKRFNIFAPSIMLRGVFTPDECKVIENLIAENHTRTMIAYRALARKYPNTDANGSYLTDRDTLKAISERIFGK